MKKHAGEQTVRTKNGYLMAGMEQVVEVLRKVNEFCLSRGESKKTANNVALFVEEMAGNVVKHGCRGREPLVELRLILKEDKRMIRIRDNGQPFDPVKWYETNHPEDPASNIGIRLVTGLAKRVQYIPAMSMNHIMIYL